MEACNELGLFELLSLLLLLFLHGVFAHHKQKDLVFIGTALCLVWIQHADSAASESIVARAFEPSAEAFIRLAETHITVPLLAELCISCSCL